MNTPPVHPDLIEYLRKKCAQQFDVRGCDPATSEQALVFLAQHKAITEVIDHLTTLLPQTVQDGLEKQKELDNELLSTEGEDAGSDPRRPGTRAGS